MRKILAVSLAWLIGVAPALSGGSSPGLPIVGLPVIGAGSNKILGTDSSGNLTASSTLDASVLTGILSDNRLSSNVPLKNAANIFTAGNIWNINAAAAPANAGGSVSQLVGADTSVARYEADSFAAASAFTARRANGTGASPTALTTNDQIGTLGFRGYYVTGGPGWSGDRASLTCSATQAWTSTNQGTSCAISTTPNNSTTLTAVATFGQDKSTTLAGTTTITANASKSALVLYDNSGLTGYTSTNDTGLEIVVNGDLNTAVQFTAYSPTSNIFDGAYFIARAAGGTPSSPVALVSGTYAVAWGMQGYNGSAFTSTKAAIFFNTTQAWTPTANGTAIRFETTANGGTFRGLALVLENDKSAQFLGQVIVPGAAAAILKANSAVTSGAGALTGTLTNSPATGNPTKWIPFNDAGVTRYIPAW